jgi:membrane-associated phospholipid phosphatase
MLHFVTDLGDAARLLPASLLLAGYLLYLRSARAALILVSTLAVCAGVTVLLKLGLHACGLETHAFGLRSPSGHASLSTAFYISSAMMFSVDRGAYARAVLMLGSAGLIAAIAVSRVLVDAHTATEVAVGLLIGLGSAAWFGFRYFRGEPIWLPWPPVILVAVALLAATQGWHLSLEDAIGRIALWLRTGIVCS